MLSTKQTVFVRGSLDYETHRRANVNPGAPERFPQSIWVVHNENDVKEALAYAKTNKMHVGVRSGGHTYHHSPLLQDGVLIDTTCLNRRIDYDPLTFEVSFGPAVQVKEISDALLRCNRFFAHGHSPSVAAGGFLLAGGQGYFMRGWGATAQQWLSKIQIVTVDGNILIASRSENQDLFWAARGSGTAFFGVVTRFWAKTIPAEQLFVTSHTFVMGEKYQELLEWAFEAASNTPKYGTDINIFTLYNENFNTTLPDDTVPQGAKLMFGIVANAYAGNLSQARVLLSAISQVPASLESALLDSKPVGIDTWDNVWALQDSLFGTQRNLNWQINSFLNDPVVPKSDLIRIMKPAVCNLPTRFSVCAICFADIDSDESDAILSVPQQIYISTFTAWKDGKLTPHIGQLMRSHYKGMAAVACGMYIADFDPNCDDANHFVWTDTALARFLEIRQKWDPDGLFPHYKAVLRTHNKLKSISGTQL